MYDFLTYFVHSIFDTFLIVHLVLTTSSIPQLPSHCLGKILKILYLFIIQIYFFLFILYRFPNTFKKKVFYNPNIINTFRKPSIFFLTPIYILFLTFKTIVITYYKYKDCYKR